MNNSERATYFPIEDYGIIGDRRTVALVGNRGSLEYLCFPHFDSPSLFAAHVDRKKRRARKLLLSCRKPLQRVLSR
ncbi:MAG: DUF5911 domain-containing protein [Opitutales bacterium]|nr:DUF5911 domain-containing protein [Opitutales bacterium]